jgi:hypothetical protein
MGYEGEQQGGGGWFLGFWMGWWLGGYQEGQRFTASSLSSPLYPFPYFVAMVCLLWNCSLHVSSFQIAKFGDLSSVLKPPKFFGPIGYLFSSLYTVQSSFWTLPHTVGFAGSPFS